MASEENGAATAVDLTKPKKCKHCVEAQARRKKNVRLWHGASGSSRRAMNFFNWGMIAALSLVIIDLRGPNSVTTSLAGGIFFLGMCVIIMLGAIGFVVLCLHTFARWNYAHHHATFYCYMGDGSNEDLQRAGWHVHLTDAGLEIIPHLTLVAPFTETSTFGSWGVANPGEILEYQFIDSLELKRVRLRDGNNNCMDILDWQQLVSIKDGKYVHVVMWNYTQRAQVSAGSLPAKVVATVVECARLDHNTQQSRTVGAAWMQVLEELARDTRLPSMAPDAQREFVQRTCARILSVARAKQPVKN